MNHREQWNTRFAGEGYVFGETPNRFLTEQAHHLPPKASILSVADGEGRNGVWLAEQGHHVVSIDISENGQAKAKSLAQKRGVTLDFRIADMADWNWPEAAFDAIVAIFIQFADPTLRNRIFAGMQQALKPGGLLLLQGYRPEQLGYNTGGPRALENLYSEAMLLQAFADWQIDYLHSHDSQINEGAGHNGMSALIDLVARRI